MVRSLIRSEIDLKKFADVAIAMSKTDMAREDREADEGHKRGGKKADEAAEDRAA